MVSFVLALNNVNIVAVTRILILHVGNGPKMNFQGRETTRLGNGIFVIPQEMPCLEFGSPRRVRCECRRSSRDGGKMLDVGKLRT